MPDNAITGAKVADRSLSAADVAVANGSPTLDLPSIAGERLRLRAAQHGHEPGRYDHLRPAPLTARPFSSGGLSLHVAKSNVARLSSVWWPATSPQPRSTRPPATFDYTAIK